MRLPRSLKRITNPVVGRVRVPILSGPNRGLWWSLASAGSGYATGRRAARQMELFAALVHPGDVVWDIGAHHGFVTLCAARRVGPRGAVHAFEPSPGNQWFLRRHVRWNDLHNVTVHSVALGSFDGESRFGGSGTSKTLALGGGEEVVTVRTARTLVAAGAAAPPTLAKLDVEGAEGDVVGGMLDVLRPDSTLLIAVHSRDAYEACHSLLTCAGFEISPSHALRESLQGRWRSDPDMVCLGPEHPGRPQTLRLLGTMGFE